MEGGETEESIYTSSSLGLHLGVYFLGIRLFRYHSNWVDMGVQRIEKYISVF